MSSVCCSVLQYHVIRYLYVLACQVMPCLHSMPSAIPPYLHTCDTSIPYRVPKTHSIPYLHRSFSAKEPYN